MTLREWAEQPGQSVFDVDCWSVARVYSPVQQRAVGFVVFSPTTPFRVLFFDSPEQIALWMRRPLDSLHGAAYFDTDWSRERATEVCE